MITNASSIPLNDTAPNLPNMGGTLPGWFLKMSLGLITKVIVNNRVQETVTNFEVMGVIQPFNAQQLEIKPEGQRAWKWHMIHCQPSFPVKPDDTIVYKGARYRIMSKWGYDDYGFCEYDAVKDYETEIPST